MNTEITDNVKSNGWILYDGDCGHCVRLAEYFRGALTRRRFELAPLQAPWVRERLGLAEPELLTEMRLLKPDGRMVGGADAVLEIGRQFWWTWPLRWLGRVPAVRQFLKAGYRWVASHRHCAGGACNVVARSSRTQQSANREAGGNYRQASTTKFADFLALLVLPLLAFECRAGLAQWVFMWAMAFALYAGCKMLTYCLAVEMLEEQKPLLKYGYLLAWPGMSAKDFLNQKVSLPKPQKIEWAFATAKATFGAILLWRIARIALPNHPLLAGWVGMTGVIFMLHFGLFHLLSLAWRQAGVNAAPVMQNPLRAASLSDFWGTRWNTAFNELAFRFAFRPLRRRTTPTVATLAVFGLSGLIHELVISLPAHGGYGLPALYFLAQGIGVVAERSRLGRDLGLGRGLRGWLFTLFITAGPAFWLFHPPFITNVILPMLTAIGAT